MIRIHRSALHFISTLLQTLVVMLFLATLPTDAATYTICNGNALTLTGMALGSSIFSLPAGCALTITSCTATDLTFATAHLDLDLVITNLDCGTRSTQISCVDFVGGITGGSIDISGVKMTITGAAGDSGAFALIHVTGAWSGMHTIKVNGNTLTSNGISSTAAIDMAVVVFVGALTGTADTGALVQLNNNVISGSAISRSASVLARVIEIAGGVSYFETVECNTNTISGFSGTALGFSRAGVLLVGGAITLTAGPASAIILRDNSALGVTATSSNDDVELYLLYIVGGINTAAITIENFNARGATISAGTHARFVGLFFHGSAALTMSSTGSLISVKNVFLGGSMTYGVIAATSFGARIADFSSMTSVDKVSVTDSGFDFSTGSGISTSAASVPVQAFLVRFRTAVTGINGIDVSQNKIDGIYAAAGTDGNVEVQILRTAKPVTATMRIAATSNLIDITATAATGSVETFNAYFMSNVDGADGTADVFDMSSSIIKGTFTSLKGYVCLGIAVFLDGATLSGFELIYSALAAIHARITEGVPFQGKHGAASILLRCGANNVNSVGSGSSDATDVSAGGIAGAVVGSVVGLILIIVIIVLAVSNCKLRDLTESQSQHAAEKKASYEAGHAPIVVVPTRA